jgi:plastocyanin
MSLTFLKTSSRFRLNLAIFILALLPLLPAAADDSAIVEGTVKLSKSAPGQPNSARYQVAIPTSESEGPAAIVYLELPSSAEPSTNAAPVQVMQKDFQFFPRLMAVQKGTLVEFPNLDDGYHNVFSYSKTKRFDLGRYRKDEKQPAVLFDEAGVVKLYCEIHEQMRSTILVVDTPHFIKTVENGKFRLEKLPAGSFNLKAWVDEKTVYSKTVEIKSGETLKVELP